jgi:hypothetical protein
MLMCESELSGLPPRKRVAIEAIANRRSAQPR